MRFGLFLTVNVIYVLIARYYYIWQFHEIPWIQPTNPSIPAITRNWMGVSKVILLQVISAMLLFFCLTLKI